MTSRRVSFASAAPAPSSSTAAATRIYTTDANRLATNGSSTESSWQGFEKLFASVLDPQTQDNHQRHLALAKNVIYQNEHGYAFASACALLSCVCIQSVSISHTLCANALASWKLAELPIVSDFIVLLRDKVSDGLTQFTDSLLAAIARCAKVRSHCTQHAGRLVSIVSLTTAPA